MQPSRRSNLVWLAGLAGGMLFTACQAYSGTPTFSAGDIPQHTPPAAEPQETPQMISEKDGMRMVYVPAGKFMMGSADTDPAGNYDEKPQHTVYLDAFWIDQTEVTVSMFVKCVQADGCAYPYGTDAAKISDYYENPQMADFPVAVDWTVADAYCRWAGSRLPTEAEWEKAARGSDGRLYPWGNTPPDPQLLNYDDGIGATTRVGSYPTGASPYGALDMAGNLWEWVSDWFSDTYYAASPDTNPQGPQPLGYRACRGGSWNSPAENVRAASRGAQDPSKCDGLVGIRCAR